MIEIVVGLRRGDVGLDVVAALSMFAALLFAEYLAAAVVAVMYSGGQYLESFAERRASREMSALLARVPRTALRQRNGGLEEVSLEAIEPGDRLVIRKGDVVPVDGAVADGTAVLDQSALTGRSVPVQRKVGSVLSGSTNAAKPSIWWRPACGRAHMRGSCAWSHCQRSRAPMSLADRYALVFLAATVALAGRPGPGRRSDCAVAVLVVATPCPLILAVPVALVSGLSRAAKQGILIKGTGAGDLGARSLAGDRQDRD
jgi:P-type E1-E2 ATPase